LLAQRHPALDIALDAVDRRVDLISENVDLDVRIAEVQEPHLAQDDVDHTRQRPDGIDLNYLIQPVEETFFRMLRYRGFDVADMSLSSNCVTLLRDPRPFVAIPVFPSRMFRHSRIYVSSAAGIGSPGDLVGKRVASPEYQMTAPVWIRGVLQDEYDVAVDGVTHLTGG